MIFVGYDFKLANKIFGSWNQKGCDEEEKKQTSVFKKKKLDNQFPNIYTANNLYLSRRGKKM